LMLAKCAEMQALRAGWPAQYAGFYDEAEFYRDRVDENDDADEQEAGRHQYCAKQSGQLRLAVHWSSSALPELISGADLIKRAPDFLRALEAQEVLQWAHLNRYALGQLWQADPRGALELKKLVDELTGKLSGMVH